MSRLACFKAYDLRGKVPTELNEDIAWKLGRAYATQFRPVGPVAIGRDIRLTSASLANALIRGLNEAGADTVEIGLCGTEMVYFAAARPGMGGGIMVTASHNPMEYNGMKLVLAGAVPVSGDSGLDELERRVRENDLGAVAAVPGTNRHEDVTAAYIEKLLSFIDPAAIKPLRIVCNAGNGCAGPILDKLAERLPLEFIRIHHDPDGTFPHGVPNPMLEETHPVTINAIQEGHAHLGIAWDGDFDRCFFFDEKGDFVEGYYIVGLLARKMLERSPGAAIIHDPRLVWNTLEEVIVAGGRPVQSKTGHAFIKERMRKEDAVYGGEMSAHHYFRDFAYCDTGMVPWLLLVQLLSETGTPLSELVKRRMELFPCSGEINSRVADANVVIAKVRERYVPGAKLVEEVDGLSVEYPEWRFNLRSSQTEPILRLNVETNADRALLEQKTVELLAMIRGG